MIEIVRAAAAQGLPTAPLVARALEGASRQADAAAILQAVRRHASGLGAARRALGAHGERGRARRGCVGVVAGVPEDSLASLQSRAAQGIAGDSADRACPTSWRGAFPPGTLRAPC